MGIRREPAHVRSDHRNNGLRACIPDARNILDHFGCFLFLRFHEIVYIIILNGGEITGGSLGLSKYPFGELFGLSLRTKTVLLIVKN